MTHVESEAKKLYEHTIKLWARLGALEFVFRGGFYINVVGGKCRASALQMNVCVRCRLHFTYLATRREPTPHTAHDVEALNTFERHIPQG